jgi:photosystem II stability/assembly factor-like uncharacterized protein
MLLLVSQVSYSQWEAKNTGFYFSGSISTFAIKGNEIFAGTPYNGIFLSTDKGNTWTNKSNGLNIFGGMFNVVSISFCGNNIFAHIDDDIFLSTDDGNSWVLKTPPGLKNITVNCLAVSSNNIIVGAGPNSNGKSSLFISSDNGNTWWNEWELSDLTFYDLAVNGNYVYANTSDFIYFSTDKGKTWAEYHDGDKYGLYDFNFMTFDGNNIYVGCSYVGSSSWGIFISTDNGKTWSKKNHGLPAKRGFEFFAIHDNNLFTLVSGEVYSSTDMGDNWIKKSPDLEDEDRIECIATIDDRILAGASHFVLISTDNGDTWKQTCHGLTNIDIYVNSLGINGNNIFVGTWSGVYLSIDKGDNWILKNSGLWPLSDHIVTSLAFLDSNIFAGTGDGVFISTNNGNSWFKKSFGIEHADVYSLLTLDNKIFAAIFGKTEKGIFLSEDFGNNWYKRSYGIANDTVYSLAANDNYIFAGTLRGLFRSADYGNYWEKSGLEGNPINSITTRGSNIFAGSVISTEFGPLDVVFISTNNGESWSDAIYLENNPQYEGDGVTTLTIKDNYIFVGTHNGVYLSADNGNSWATKNGGLSPDLWVSSFDISGDYIFMGTRGDAGVYRAKISDLVLDVKEDDPAPVDIYFYPNPVSDYLYIDISAEFEPVQSIEIYDQLGRLLKNVPSNSLATHTLSIFVGDLSPSIYFLKIQKHGSYIYKKFIKI